MIDSYKYMGDAYARFLDNGKELKISEFVFSVYDLVIPVGATVIDVGAHSGMHSAHMNNLIGENGHVIAFEPQPEMFKVTRARFDKLDSHCQFDLYPYALADYNGTTEFNIIVGQTGLSSLLKRPMVKKQNMQTKTIEVEVRKLDDLGLNLNRLDFMKVDTEAADFLVLRGARETIQKFRPFIIFEAGRFKFMPARLSNYTAEEYLEFFKSMNYKLVNYFCIEPTLESFNHPNTTDLFAIPEERGEELINLINGAMVNHMVNLAASPA